MADRKSGPVKPPVIDLTARDAKPGPGSAEPQRERAEKSSPKPKAAAASASAGRADAPATEQPQAAAGTAETLPPPPPPSPPRPPARLAMPWSAISVSAIAGALLGTGLTYLLASWIMLPSHDPVIADPTPELIAHAARLEGLEVRFAALEEASLRTQVSLDATIAQLDEGLAGLRQDIAEVRSALPEAGGPDAAAFQRQLETLAGRVEAIAAGASSADADALTEGLAALEDSLAEQRARTGAIDAELATATSQISALAAELATARAAIAAQGESIGDAGIGPAVKLPLVVAGLETALASGRPYAAELEALRGISPELAVPDAVEAAAAEGLARPDELASRFAAALPDILGGRTSTSTGDWSRDALEWARGLLALRPAGEIEGDAPDAVVSRLEGAMQRRDFSAAAALMGQLPAPMRDAAGDLAGEIATHAEAETFIAGLRARALATLDTEAAQ